MARGSSKVAKQLILLPLRIARQLCYFTARFLGDIIAIIQGPDAYLKRLGRKKGLTVTSGWSKRI